MSDLFSTAARGVLAFVALVVLALVPPLALPGTAGYQQDNLTSDLPGTAPQTNPNLVNPWGIAFSQSGPFWISGNNSGVALVLRSDGTPFPNSAQPLVVTIPLPGGGSGGAPTGVVFNGTDDFVVKEAGKSGPATFIFATEDGTISGWNHNVDPANAIIRVDRSTVGLGAVYKGLASGKDDGQDFIYATNFRFGTVEMFDAQFHLVKSFTDSALANKCPFQGQCFAPFGIRNINGNLYVTFALQKPGKHDDLEGAGNGFVDVFSTEGHLLRRFASQGALNSPWGLALAPERFGRFSKHLLIGDFGDGRINAYDFGSGGFDGQLADKHGTPITIMGLWGLTFGNGGQAGEKDQLFFTAGIVDETHGLFGRIESEVEMAEGMHK